MIFTHHTSQQAHNPACIYHDTPLVIDPPFLPGIRLCSAIREGIRAECCLCGRLWDTVMEVKRRMWIYAGRATFVRSSPRCCDSHLSVLLNFNNISLLFNPSESWNGALDSQTKEAGQLRTKRVMNCWKIARHIVGIMKWYCCQFSKISGKGISRRIVCIFHGNLRDFTTLSITYILRLCAVNIHNPPKSPVSLSESMSSAGTQLNVEI